jgi:hypothetical protein
VNTNDQGSLPVLLGRCESLLYYVGLAGTYGSLVASAFLLTSAVGRAQQSAAWRDPSKHEVQFVAVDEGVQLEVLD